MILQALNEYYQRKTRLPDNNLAPPNFEHKAIPFLIVLTKDGEFAELDDTREGEGKKKVAKSYLVPQRATKSVNVVANLLWGNSEYIFGVADPKKLADKLANAKTEKRKEQILQRLQEQRLAFLAAIHNSFARFEDVGIQAIQTFLEQGNFEKILVHPLCPEILESGANLTFRLEGDPYPVCERESVTKKLSSKDQETDAKTGLCLVSGDMDEIERLHPSIQGVQGAQPSGAKLVSFQKDSGYDSYAKEQGANAPVGRKAAFAYTTALNHLLAKSSKQRIQISDASTIFWAATPGHPMEELFPGFFGEPSKDNPDLGTQAVAALFAAPKTGAGSFEDDGTCFYVLGLSAPSLSRLTVRFWHVKTVGELAVNIRQHFKNIEIVSDGYDYVLTINTLLAATAMETKYDSAKANLVYWRGKYYDVKPNLGGEVMRSVIENLLYPQTLLSGAIRRIRAEQEVTYPRAAIIKACINRQSGKEELKVSLDENNTNTAYRLGRLFAVLERIQERANPNINATIRDRYYGAASGTPVTVFSTLLKLKNHHLAKLDSKGEVINYEKLLGQIMDGITDFPTQLDLQNQGRFAIGY